MFLNYHFGRRSPPSLLLLFITVALICTGATQRGMGRPRDQRGLRRTVGEMALGIVWKQLQTGGVGVKKDL